MAKGRAQILAQPIPEIPIIIATTIGFFEKNMPKYAKIMVINEKTCTFWFENFEDKTPIGIATKKQIKLNIAKHIDEKFVPFKTALEYKAFVASSAVVKSGTE